MRKVEDWLAEYGTSHEHPANKALHWVCVPLIVFAVLGLLWSVPVPGALAGLPFANWATLAALETPLWQICLVIFVVAWIGQFIGHALEGRRPSFFKDLQFLLIGPLWLLGFVYRRLGLRY